MGRGDFEKRDFGKMKCWKIVIFGKWDFGQREFREKGILGRSNFEKKGILGK